MNEQLLPEPLENFLQHPPTAPADAAMQASLAQRTIALLPPPRGRRPWPVVAAAAAVVLALVSAYFVWRSHEAPVKHLVEHKTEPAPPEKRERETPKEEPAPK